MQGEAGVAGQAETNEGLVVICPAAVGQQATSPPLPSFTAHPQCEHATHLADQVQPPRQIT